MMMAGSSRRGKVSLRRKLVSELTQEDLMNATNESDMIKTMRDFLRQRMEEIVKLSCTLIPAASDEDERNRLISSCEMNLKSLIMDELVYIEADKISEKLAQKIIAKSAQTTDGSKMRSEIDDIEKQTTKRSAEYRAQIKEKDIQAHPMFKKLTQKISEILVSSQLSPEHDGEDANASLICEDHIPTIDPITKNPLIDPIKNSICGHVYGQSSIEQLLKASSTQRIRCPEIGCSNKNYVQKKHLIEDTVLAAKIRNKIAKESQQIEAIDI